MRGYPRNLTAFFRKEGRLPRKVGVGIWPKGQDLSDLFFGRKARPKERVVDILWLRATVSEGTLVSNAREGSNGLSFVKETPAKESLKFPPPAFFMVTKIDKDIYNHPNIQRRKIS